MKRVVTILVAVVASALAPMSAYAQRQPENFSCDFVQTRHTAMLEEDAVSYGRMYFSSPMSVRWEYTSPNKFTLIIHENLVMVNNEGKKKVIDVNKHLIFKDVSRHVSKAVMNGNLEGSDVFKVTIEEEGGICTATMIPRKMEFKNKWDKWILVYDSRTMAGRRFEMYEKSGDCTIIEFKNMKLGPVDPAVFQFEQEK